MDIPLLCDRLPEGTLFFESKLHVKNLYHIATFVSLKLGALKDSTNSPSLKPPFRCAFPMRRRGLQDGIAVQRTQVRRKDFHQVYTCVKHVKVDFFWFVAVLWCFRTHCFASVMLLHRHVQRC